MPESIDWNDAGMFELAGDLGLLDEPGAAVEVVGMSVLDFLECDPAVELLVERRRRPVRAPPWRAGEGPETERRSNWIRPAGRGDSSVRIVLLISLRAAETRGMLA